MIQKHHIFSKSRFMILLIVFLGCLLISGVSAADLDDNATGHDVILTEGISQESNDFHSFDELSEMINQTPENHVLTLDNDYVFANGSYDGIVISKPITIDGRGHTLDGNMSSRIFKVTADNVVIKNVNFINGNAIGSYVRSEYGGGAIYWSGDNGHVENCSFKNNRQYTLEFPPDKVIVDGDTTTVVSFAVPAGAKTSEGGAITWLGLNGTVNKCLFENNDVGYCNHGGAIYWKGDSGRVIDSEFYKNSAWLGAAIYWSGNNGTLVSSILLHEYNEYRSVFEDELLYWTGENATIRDSVLIDAVIQSSNVSCDYNFWGDTLENPNMAAKPDSVSCWILLNLIPDKVAVEKGDVVTFMWDFTNLIDSNGTVSKYGGINKSHKTIFVADDIGNVNAQYLYDQIYFEIVSLEYWDLNLLAQKISEIPEGGQLVLDRNYIYINGTNKGITISKQITIDGRGHTLNGNGLSRLFNITADEVVIKNINFINGNAYGKYFSNDVGGGAIYWSGDNGYIENCSFTNNSGSGIEDDPFDVEETWVDENGRVISVYRARPMGAKTNEGGAIVWNGTNGTVFKCTFRNNGVGYPNAGGAICWRGDFGRVLESEFYNNDAWSGASICWVADSGTILNSKFINTGEVFGRDIMWFGKNGTIRYSFLITSNGQSPLYVYSGDVDADYNFWGGLLANTKLDKISNLNNCIVLDAKANKNFVKKGETIVVTCRTLLLERDGSVSDFSGLNVSGNFTAKADRDGFVQFYFVNGKLTIKIVPKTKIVSKNLIKYFKQSKQFKIRLYGADGKVAAGKYVKFTIGKKTYTVKTDRNGYATLNVNHKPGSYVVITQYDNVKVKNKITVKTTLITKNISKKVKKSARFTVKVLNSNGKAAAKKFVLIKFKGKNYLIITNKKGIATFNIPKNLKLGKYAITTTSRGLTNNNMIVVKK